MSRKQLPTPADLSVTAIEWAKELLPEEYKNYDGCILFINPCDERTARKIMKITDIRSLAIEDSFEEDAWEIRFYKKGHEAFVVYSPES